MHLCPFPFVSNPRSYKYSLRLLKYETFCMLSIICILAVSRIEKKKKRGGERGNTSFPEFSPRQTPSFTGARESRLCCLSEGWGLLFPEQDEGGTSLKVPRLSLFFNCPILRETKQINPSRFGDEKGSVRTEYWSYFYLHQLQAAVF